MFQKNQKFQKNCENSRKILNSRIIERFQKNLKIPEKFKKFQNKLKKFKKEGN